MKYLKSNMCKVVFKTTSWDGIPRISMECATPHEKCPRCGHLLNGSCPKKIRKFSFNLDCFLFK